MGLTSRRPSRPGGALIATGTIAVVAVALAIVGWTRGGNGDRIQLNVESHGLDEDQASCLRFGSVESRFEATVPQQSPDDPLSPQYRRSLAAELEGLDAVAKEYPAADYRIIRAVTAAADRTAGIIDGAGGGVYRGYSAELDDREKAVEAAGLACQETAGFDTADLAPN